jgi:hypothetical protein
MTGIAIETHVDSDVSLALETLKAALRPALVLLALAGALAALNLVNERVASDFESAVVVQGEELRGEWAHQRRAESFDAMYRPQH